MSTRKALPFVPILLALVTLVIITVRTFGFLPTLAICAVILAPAELTHRMTNERKKE